MLLGIWWLADATAQSAPASEQDYLVKNWTTADGVPHNTVRSIIESRDGYLWLGTANGLARFDGVRFTVFDLASSTGLISDDIFSVYEDRHGTLWLRTRRGVARRIAGRFESLTVTNMVMPFGAFVEDTEGTLWALARNSLSRWVGDQFETVALNPDGPRDMRAVCASPDGGLWLGAENGLWRYRNGGAKLMAQTPVASLLSVGPGGQLWGLVSGRQLVLWRDGRWVSMANTETVTCTTLYAAPNGDVWMGAESLNLAFRWREGTLVAIGGEQGIEGNRVLAFAQDHDGNTWIGLNAGGMYRLRERRVRMLDRKNGFEGLNLSSLCELTDGTMMVNVMGSTLHRITADHVVPLQIRNTREVFALPTAVIPAADGGVWAGTFYGTLPRIMDGREVERVGSSNGTRTLFTDRDGRLWRGTRTGGIEVFQGTNVTSYTTKEGLSFNNVYCFAQDREGALWAGTEQGLNRIRDGQISVFGTSNGLGHQFVSALHVDTRGTLWVGTLGGGLSAWNGSNFATLTTREGLAHNAVDQLIEDDFGHLWLGTRAGLMRLSVAQLHEFIAGKLRVVTGTIVGRDEGLLRANLWTEYQPATVKARDGRLWFCTGSGAAVLDPRRFEKPAAAPIVHIEEAKVDGQIQLIHSRDQPVISIPPGTERVEIRYTGIGPSEPAQVRFRYQLAGYDRDWAEAGRARIASYSHLPPGSYQFRVAAVNNDGVWSENSASLSFNVRPRFWQTGWFRAVSLLAMAGALYGVYRLRLRRVELRRMAQEAFSRQLINSQEQERKRIAAELHDSLGQNLLVIKNRAALALAQRDQPEKMVLQIGEVSTMASAAIREVREIAQNLRPFQLDELGFTKSIAAMARSLEDSTSISFAVDVDDVDGILPPEFEINLYRIIQECLNNAAKHSGARSAIVRLRRESGLIKLTIMDDGRGFDSSILGGTLNGSGSFGLRNIVERARTMAGNVRCDSGPGDGTRFDVEIPVKAR